MGQFVQLIIEVLRQRNDHVVDVDGPANDSRKHLHEHLSLTVFIGSFAIRPAMDELISKFKHNAIIHAAASYK
ncbi:MAG: hypothetical protein ACKPE2_01930, partial [Dolichospermum sp.]